MKKSIPIIVGVTGHLDVLPIEIERIKDEFRSYLNTIKERYKSSKIIIVSGLAIGWDTIAVDIAIEKSMKFIGLLPMPKNEFEKDFTNSEDLIKFRKLCDKAYTIYEGPYYLNKYSEMDRNKCYEDLGKRLAEHSDFLVAFFDEYSVRKTGGTADVICMRATGKCSSYLNRSSLGEMVGGRDTKIIPVVRKSLKDIDRTVSSKENTVNQALKLVRKTSHDIESNKKKDSIFDMWKYDQFNQKINKIAETENYDMGNIYPFEKYDGEISDECSSSMDYINAIYLYADHLSLKSRKKKRSKMFISFCVVMLAIICFEVFGIVELPVFLVGFVGCYIFILIGYRYLLNMNDNHNDFVEYRVLAELLRIQYFWNMVGLNKQIIDYFPLKSRETMGWIKQALRSIQIITESKIKFTDNPLLRYKIGIANWVEDQKRFYEGAIEKQKGYIKKRDYLIRFGFSSALIAIVLSIVMTMGYSYDVEHIVIILLVGYSGFVTAATALYADKISVESFEELRDRYEMMIKAYTSAKEGVESSKNDIVIKEIFFEIGIESLNEYSDWHYFQQSKDGKLF